VDDDIAVTVVGSEPEAELACQLLHTEGIVCFYRPTNYAAGAGDGLVSGGAPREIVVRAVDAQRARELLLDR
jgi:hypothetical protein